MSRRGHPLVVAHRGFSAAHPENTLRSIEAAFAAGAEACEVDVRRSGDGVPVLLHDRELSRTTNGTGRVDVTPLDRLRQLDAGEGEGVATVEEAALLARGRGRLFLDIKVLGLAPALAEVSARLGLCDLLVACVWQRLEAGRYRVTAPDLRCYHVGRAPRRAARGTLGRLIGAGVSGLSYEADSLTPEFCRLAHDRELEVLAWTVNDPETLSRLTAMEVDGVVTDDPVACRRALGG